MSNNLIETQNVVLFGVGKMGLEYTKVLQSLKVPFSVVGRGELGVAAYKDKTGVDAVTGGVKNWKCELDLATTSAIVAVNVEELAETTLRLLALGFRNILLEKPAGLTVKEIEGICAEGRRCGSRIIVAYNRRFYASLLAAQKIIEEDGGVTSFHFEFTEWPHTIHEAINNDEVKKNWFLANSSHVADMAFFLGGLPSRMQSYVSGGAAWHPSGTVFAGAGITEKGALFSYQANWDAPGRWGIEILTNSHRLFFRPLEKLQIQNHRSVDIEQLALDDHLDVDFKPGLYLQTKFFLQNYDHPNFVSIDAHHNNVSRVFSKIVCPIQQNKNNS